MFNETCPPWNMLILKLCTVCTLCMCNVQWDMSTVEYVDLDMCNVMFNMSTMQYELSTVAYATRHSAVWCSLYNMMSLLCTLSTMTCAVQSALRHVHRGIRWSWYVQCDVQYIHYYAIWYTFCFVHHDMCNVQWDMSTVEGSIASNQCSSTDASTTD